jgi:type I restriction enzyme R subunit
MTPIDKRDLSERDICTKYITPAIAGSSGAGWDIQTQIREEVTFTKGLILDQRFQLLQELFKAALLF